MTDTKISAATSTTLPLATDMLPFARSGDTTARKITVGNFLANAPTGIKIPEGTGYRIATQETAIYSISSYTALFSGIKDAILDIGFNVDQEDPTRWTWLIQFESHFQDNMEWMLAATPPVGSGLPGRRPMFVTFDQLTNTATHNFGGDVFFKDNDLGNGKITIKAGGNLEVGGGGDLRGVDNNIQWLKQKGADSVYRSLMLLNAANQVSIAVDGGATVFGGKVGIQKTPAALLDVTGTVTPSTAIVSGFLLAPTINPTNNSDVYVFSVAPAITTPAGVTTTAVQSARFDAPTITLGSGSVLTYGMTVYIAGAPSVGTNQFALYVESGKIAFPSLPIYANNAAAALGGLIAGALYRTGGDPDTVCVRH